MLRSSRLVCLMGWLLFIGISANVWGQGLRVDVNKDGVKSLRFGGVEFVERASLFVGHVVIKDGEGSVIESIERGEKRRSFDLLRKQVSMEFEWGTVICEFKGRVDRLDISITVQNNSPYILSELGIDLLAMQFPSSPKGWTAHTPYRSFCYGEPGITIADCGTATVAVCNEQVGQPVVIGWAGRESTVKRPVVLMTRSDWVPELLNPVLYRPIYPGVEDEFRMSIRFSAGSKDRTEMAADVMDAFRVLNPYKLEWEDRRPIGAIHLSSSDMKIAKNPRGWFMDRDADFVSEAGQKEFRRRLMERAKNAIEALKTINAQGMITWDLEGQEYPHAISYLGDPRSLPAEMEAVVDEYFELFRKAGFRTGVTLRPQMPVRKAYSEGVMQIEVADAFAVLDAKLTYAKERWGCTLFYVDSNGDPGVPFDAEIFTRLARKHPDVLLIPEHETKGYYARTSPYRCYANLGQLGTPKDIRELYPEAFSVIAVAHKNPIEDKDKLVEDVRRGDILLVNAWFMWDGLDGVNAIYEAAGKKNISP